ncbi:TetR/AcrR family transcriptional regulator [Rhodococcus sp. HNM0569]|uniref:TetR/AcrR family transcriptional regulator n=1 Tax=Rhodococcus sp. HNM0569 TaxID=2716340 RepID=UPI001469FEDE|nr:TetR/AcrR family transcriptional regulator [Rhodococcus sp. HNM0569]NLU83916.1 TetR family transcriptional regulator [Rhodococcus sp. HNM0569]
MLTRLPADERRRQLVESALSIAERTGVASVTVRAVAEEAGVSLGVVHYCFESKDELLAAMGEALILQLSESMHEAFGRVRHAPELKGVSGLRELLHIGLSGIWPVIEQTPDRQLLTYEITAQSLRSRGTEGDRAARVSHEQYRLMDAEAIEFLDTCAEMAEVTWTVPVVELARTALAFIDGVVLRWLVDRNSEAVVVMFDDLAQAIADKAVTV